MRIGWYPGHMHKARKDITLALQRVDAVIEILDARLPYGSANPLLNQIIGDKYRLKLLNKADLADPLISEAWLQYFQQQGVKSQLFHKDDKHSLQQLLQLFCKALPELKSRSRRIMIVGIPNVGKSTLINLLAQRKLARVGNEPAVTKARQEIKLSDSLVLLDTPGILWPKLEDQDAAYRLAISGAIRNTAIELADVGLKAVEMLLLRYPHSLQDRYGVETCASATETLEAIGRKRGCLSRGGVDFNKAAEVILNELRSGKLGRISLETPDDIPLPAEEDEAVEDNADGRS